MNEISGTKDADLASSMLRLREQANGLPEAERHVALEHVERLEQHVAAETVDALRMRVLLKGLETFGPLVPYVASVLNALSNVGA